MITGEVLSFILAILAAAAAGLVGAFTLMKRLALAGDVISHIALPGLGLAILFQVNPLIGGAATLFLGILIIWKLGKKTGLTTDVTIGVIFASAVAIGALITPEEELIDALFGKFDALSTNEFVIGILLSLLAIYLLWKLKDRLILGLFSQDLAGATRINTDRLNLYFLLIFGLTVMLGLRFLGALLMGSLIIIPAAAARQLTHTLRRFLLTSVGISVLSVTAGFALAMSYDLNLGPMVVIVATTIFALSLFKKKD